MGKKTISINGRFTNRRVTGQERFAFELVSELDKIVERSHLRFELVVPQDAVNVPDLKNIEVKKFGKAGGSLWEQLCFACYLFRTGAVSLNLCSVMPALRPGIVCIHDLSYKVNPGYFKTLYARVSRIWHEFQYWLAWRYSPVIYTVSEYSKRQMVETCHVSPDRIVVIGNGWEHFRRVEEDRTLEGRKPELFERPYFFSLGSLAPNKNMEWVLEVAKRHPQYDFHIAGKGSLKAYGTSYGDCDIPNVRFLGYVSDGEVKLLMRRCKAFIFPSFYEGFGIPPLEALSVGAKVIVARSSCLPEIFGDSAYYVDPRETDIDIDDVLSKPVGPGEVVLQKYRFSRFAGILLDSLEDMAKGK